MKIRPSVCDNHKPLPRNIAALARQVGPIEFWPIDRLHTYANNPRKHSEKQIVKLMASVSEFGIALPILVDPVGTIIAGEAVSEAASAIAGSKWNGPRFFGLRQGTLSDVQA